MRLGDYNCPVRVIEDDQGNDVLYHDELGEEFSGCEVDEALRMVASIRNLASYSASPESCELGLLVKRVKTLEERLNG